MTVCQPFTANFTTGPKCGKYKPWVFRKHLPGHDDDKVELVPPVAKITVGAENPKRHHLDDHFHGEESEDAVVQHLKQRSVETKGGKEFMLNAYCDNKEGEENRKN